MLLEDRLRKGTSLTLKTIMIFILPFFFPPP